MEAITLGEPAIETNSDSKLENIVEDDTVENTESFIEKKNNTDDQLSSKWRDRCTRLEAAITKQREKIAELEETESKLKRFLLMTKRSIENSKIDIEKKDKEIDALRIEREECRADIEKTKEEFRRYRVRAEINRQQQEAEISRAQANSAARQQQLLAGSDLATELNCAREQIQRLSKLQTELDEQENQWNVRYEKLLRENERLKGAAGETAIAAEWRARYENVVREKDELLVRIKGGQSIPSSSTSCMTPDPAQGSLEENYLKLKKEYALYRKRALQVVEEKEQALLAAQNQLMAAGITASPAADTSTPVSLEAKTDEYLKNIVVKYMSTEQVEVKEHMEAAIATLLKFTPSELKHVQEKRKNSLGWGLW